MSNSIKREDHVPKYLLRASGPAVRRADDIEADHGDASVAATTWGQHRVIAVRYRAIYLKRRN
ncbi:Hypothetical protein SMAX5B_014664 [Scophthalmus maximus]|uniref:Uncharacterized protein n=1 Tax=Scophthalmus maximus TaxID=52904 RepID=A0A2U9C376_SCOMX|nr:Hypothetical protein SMAX5B_014664 [Scophthalmus maximus]